MNKTQEALKMAIEQIKWAEHLHDWHDGLLDAIKVCKEALEHPAQEPIGYYYPDERSAYLLFQKGLEIPKDALPLYENPTPAQKPMAWNEEKFNAIAYAYRASPSSKIKMVSEKYKALIDYVLSIANPAPQWQGLSDNEINQLYYSLKDINDFKDIIRVIEKKLKDKNT